MKEFGSDYHEVHNYPKGESLISIISPANYYADGRQAILSIIQQEKWHRIWLPVYFCYEVIDTIRATGITIAYYNDNPLISDETSILNSLPFKSNDVLFRINYFGVRTFRDNSQIPVDVIEDHSHDLIGGWALRSNATWCIASLRKTLPLDEGGILWSPKGLPLPPSPCNTSENIYLSDIRCRAMQLKTKYLRGESSDKSKFRSLYIQSESLFESLPISAISPSSHYILSQLDIQNWYNYRVRNWEYLMSNIHFTKVKPLYTEGDSCNIFSFALLFETKAEMELVRQKMIAMSIFPAILWTIPDVMRNTYFEEDIFLLSIHCDGRYSLKNMRQLTETINRIIDD